MRAKWDTNEKKNYVVSLCSLDKLFRSQKTTDMKKAKRKLKKLTYIFFYMCKKNDIMHFLQYYVEYISAITRANSSN